MFVWTNNLLNQFSLFFIVVYVIGCWLSSAHYYAIPEQITNDDH